MPLTAVDPFARSTATADDGASTARVLNLPVTSHTDQPQLAHTMVCRDPRSTALLGQVERIARSGAPVLVCGETGTGKELIARHLHAHSGRRGPFVAVNCGAFSDTLVDAELFGHEAGAYTGATQARAGWFEAAQGGTLFLDEIGDLAPALQVKLLRVLQERQVVRLGARRPITLDVRLVAATNVDLQRAVVARQFRADLYYRLAVASVTLPPLRERPHDILALAQHFIGVFGPRLDAAQAQLTTEAQAELLAHAWPGNIRELENVIHYALIFCRDGTITPGDLRIATPAGTLDPANTTAHDAAPGASTASSTARPSPTGDTCADDGLAPSDAAAPASPRALPREFAAAVSTLLASGVSELFRSVEFTLVHQAYARCDGNQVQAARLLDISRNSLRTLLRNHGLLPAPPQLP